MFRYGLIREAADAGLSRSQRGRLVRHLAGLEHRGPDGELMTVGRRTIDRWINDWQEGGFEALIPKASMAGRATPVELLDLARCLKLEEPGRTAAQVARLIEAEHGYGPSERTVQRHFADLGLNRRPDGARLETFGRFEAARRNDLWTGDAMHGPIVGDHKTYLLAFIDDHSRLLVGYRWCLSEDTIRMESALRYGLAARGVPARIYVDNGSAFVSKQLLRACARLGISLIHSRPRRPQGRGKIERFFRTVRDQFVTEITSAQITSVAELNRLFASWVETVYHHRTHSETGQAPLDRFTAVDPPELPDADQLREAFLWAEERTVTKTATVSMFSNEYEVDAALVGQRVELVFDPFNLTDIDVVCRGRTVGKAVPFTIGRHVHPQAKPEPDKPKP